MSETPIISATKSKKPIITIIILLISVAGLAGALVWSLVFKPKDATVVPVSTSSSSTATVSTGPCVDDAENVAPTGYVFYENAELGYKFAYPSEWGNVTVTTTPIASEVGKYVQGSFSAKNNVKFGGNEVGYTVRGRGGMATDLPGYLEAAGQFYIVELWKFTDGTTTETRSALHLIDAPYEQKTGCNANALVTHQAASAEMGTPAADIVRFNLQPTNQYYGVNFVITAPDAATQAQIDQIIPTFELLAM